MCQFLNLALVNIPRLSGTPWSSRFSSLLGRWLCAFGCLGKVGALPGPPSMGILLSRGVFFLISHFGKNKGAKVLFMVLRLQSDKNVYWSVGMIQCLFSVTGAPLVVVLASEQCQPVCQLGNTKAFACVSFCTPNDVQTLALLVDPTTSQQVYCSGPKEVLSVKFFG